MQRQLFAGRVVSTAQDRFPRRALSCAGRERRSDGERGAFVEEGGATGAALLVPLDAGERPAPCTPPSMDEVTRGRLCSTLSRWQ